MMRRLRLSSLHIEDEPALEKIAVYAALKQQLLDDGYAFRVLGTRQKPADWNRATLLNLAFWTPRSADVLVAPSIAADVVAHVAWHQLVAKRLGKAATSADGLLFGESIASGFDMYLVGQLLRLAPRATFLTTQVPEMAEVAQSAGLSARGFSSLLHDVTADPEDAFGDLQQLLFRVATRLLRAKSPEAAAIVIQKERGHRFHPLLHHYNFANWVLYARAYAKPAAARLDARVGALAARAKPSPLSLVQ